MAKMENIILGIALVSLILSGVAIYYVYTAVTDLRKSVDFLTFIAAPEGIDRLMGARDEGKLLVYNSMAPAIVEAYNKAFMKKYPFIEVEYVTGDDNTLMSRFEAERSSGRQIADVVETAIPALLTKFKNNGWMMQYESPGYANFNESVKNEGYWCGIQAVVFLVARNTDYVNDTEIASYADLLNPKYQGKICGVNPLNSAAFLSLWWWINQTMGPEFLTELATQNVIFLSGSTPGREMTASGETWINIADSDAQVRHYNIDLGAPVAPVYPQEGVTSTIRDVFIADNAPHPNAAKLYMDFMLSEDAAAISAENGYSPTFIGAAPPEGVRPLTDIPLWTANYTKYESGTPDFQALMRSTFGLP
ncbi:extracellular solute-binding protein [Candidatus Bathyarchaeota archaeon]|nr:extracellular solute-binding protein [Candidatus Bathyarchaeota archaeon]